MKRVLALLLALVTTPIPAPAADPAPPIRIRVDAAQSLGELRPIWRFFGADEPNYATMKDGRRLLGELGELRPQQVYFRCHNLLCTGDGTPALKWGSTGVYREDEQGRPVYDWTILDRIFEAGLSRGVRPFAQIGFMPQALSVQPEPYQHEWRPGLPYERIVTGWAWPPKDYDRWRELVFQWVRHCVERWGRAEVEQWYWEVWNEANGYYWKGTPEEFYKLHDYAIDGVRRALPTARVGGPHVAGSGGRFMDGFLEHVVRGTNHATGLVGTPVDFLAFHAKGAPQFVGGHVRLGIAAHLNTIDQGFAKIAAVPELRTKPIVIGESDPDGCAACQGPQLGYRTGTLYSSYTAACFARKHALADKHGVHLEGALTWAFEFEDQPYFAGQRVLASNGIDLPVLNVFRMFSRMGGQRLKTASSAEVPLEVILRDGVRAAPDVAALASLEGNRLSVMVWHYHDDDLPGPEAPVELVLEGLPRSADAARLTRFQIDQEHSNAYATWQRMGSPNAPTEPQYRQLREAGQLARIADAPETVPLTNGSLTLHFPLPRQAVTLLSFDLPSAEARPWTAQQDHRNMMDQLGIVRLRPGPSGREGATNSANYDPARANPYPDYPEVLTLKEGRPVTSPEMWWQQRRPEIVEDFEREVYGRIPKSVPAVTWSIRTQALDRVVGTLPVNARQLVGRVDNAACPSIEVQIQMTLVTPKDAPGPVPVLMMFGGFGGGGFPRRPGEPAPTNRFASFGGGTFADPPSTEQLIAAGWGYATLVPDSIQADNGAGLTRGIIGLVNQGRPRQPDDWGSLRAWAWGAARALDHLETDPTVDARKVGIEGVSRFGKAALVTLAFEPRFALALVGSSGAGGAKPFRRNFGEAVENLTGSGEYHWMAGNFLKYGTAESSFGPRDAADLPVESHELIALCAPRPTFISYGIPAKGDANWLDQQGSYMATVAAGPVFRLLGARDLGVPDDYRTATMPPVNTGLLDGELAWRQHDGGHEDRTNMKHFLAWAGQRLGLGVQAGR